MNTFSVSTALRFGWDTFKKRTWFLIGSTFLILFLSWAVSAIQNAQNNVSTIQGIIVFVLALAVSTLIDMGLTALFLRAHDDVAKVAIKDIWYPKPFWKYLGTTLLVGFLTIVGFIALIVPGLILMTIFAFVKILVIDRDLGPITAMKESVRITRGHRLELFLLLLAAIGINILGAIALLVGLLITIPVTMLALVHAYRTLSSTSSETNAGPREHPHTTRLPRAPKTSAI